MARNLETLCNLFNKKNNSYQATVKMGHKGMVFSQFSRLATGRMEKVTGQDEEVIGTIRKIN